MTDADIEALILKTPASGRSALLSIPGIRRYAERKQREETLRAELWRTMCCYHDVRFFGESNGYYSEGVYVTRGTVVSRMSEKLDIFEDYRNSGYYLAWVIDGDQGAEITTKPPSDDAEAKAIVEAVRPFARQQGKGYSVFVFDSKASATQALRAARAAVKSTKATTPWPDWAITAAAHGWAAPKTWKP